MGLVSQTKIKTISFNKTKTPFDQDPHFIFEKPPISFSEFFSHFPNLASRADVRRPAAETAVQLEEYATRPSTASAAKTRGDDRRSSSGDNGSNSGGSGGAVAAAADSELCGANIPESSLSKKSRSGSAASSNSSTDATRRSETTTVINIAKQQTLEIDPEEYPGRAVRVQLCCYFGKTTPHREGGRETHTHTHTTIERERATQREREREKGGDKKNNRHAILKRCVPGK